MAREYGGVAVDFGAITVGYAMVVNITQFGIGYSVSHNKTRSRPLVSAIC